MRLKIYQALNISAAMAMVRDELGPDALILANRTVDGGVELTAAQELPAAAAAQAVISAEPEPLAQSRPAFASSSTPINSSELARAGTLRWHGVPPDLATRFGRGDLTKAIEDALSFDEVPCNPGDAPLLLVGPPGAGKTLTAARIVTRLKLSGQSAMVITADGRRAGAAEQLAAFTRLLGLTLIAADTPKLLARAIDRRADGEPVLVDMPGLNPADPQDQTYLRECQVAIGASIALVLPAGLDPADAQEMAQDFRELGATCLIATRLDQSRRLGGLLAAASTGLALTEAGTSPAVADGLTRMTPAFIAERLSYARSRETGTSGASPLASLARAYGEQERSEQ
ncbi:MAG: GTP-binding protein [Pseudomonadota bacterium]|nr:GTP-binding protein [Pseudomonadota bacterium]